MRHLVWLRRLMFGLAACGPSTPADPSPSSSSSAEPRAATAEDVVQVAVGAKHACLLTRGGRVECWGWNDLGQLGDGSLTPHFRPEPVRDLTDAVDIAAYVDGTCAARRDGTVWCWGRHASWRGGDGDRRAPAKLDGLSEVAEVQLSAASVVATTRSKMVRVFPGTAAFGPAHDVAVGPFVICWLTPERSAHCRADGSDSGYPAGGVETTAASAERAEEIFALGDGACVLSPSKQPMCFSRRATDGVVDVARPPVSGVRAFATAYARACAATVDGRLACFQAGMEKTVTVVEGAGEVTGLALDEHVGCVVRVDGTVHCWGNGEWGQLGNGSTAKAHAPVVVRGLPPIADIAATKSEHFALAEDGRLFRWGLAWSRQGGPGRAEGPSVEAVPPVQRVSASPHLACVILRDGAVLCRRDAEDGGKPDATLTRWTEIPSLSGAREITGVEVSFQKHDGEARYSDDLVYAVDAKGDVSVFRSGSISEVPPVPLEGVHGVTSLGVATDHGCGVTSGGRVLCWHHKFLTEVGLHGGRAAPYLVRAPLTDVKRAEGACLVRVGGAVECHGVSVDGARLVASESHGDAPWRRALFGASCMGHGDRSYSCRYGSMTQLDHVELGGVTAVRLAADAACALRDDRTVVCWGDNTHGRVGIAGTWTAERPVPVERALRP